jgi:hypothetical protein
MRARWPFIFVSILILVAGIAEAASLHVSAEAFAQEHAWPSYDYEVLYTPSGFVPDYLQVPLGARVAFRNASTSTQLWVASDPYPTGSDYPALNEQGTSSATYIFQFTQTGTFGYHNQTAPIDTAVIAVADPQRQAPDISKTLSRQEAVRDKLVAMLIPGKPSSISAVISAIQSDPLLSLDCHEVAHDVGHRAYELYGFSGAMLLNGSKNEDHASVMDMCAGGYVHGILEEESLHDPSFAADPGALCASVPPTARPTCYHGIGHALMFVHDRDIPASLDGCRKLPVASYKQRCFEGVWMEAFSGNTEHSGHNTLGWDIDDPLATCALALDDAQPTCFLYSTFGYARTHPKDYAGAVRMCTEDGLTEQQSSFCLKGVGIALVAHLKAKDLEESEPYAAGLTAAQKLGFYEGVAGYGRLSGLSDEALGRMCAAMKSDATACAEAIRQSR